MARQPVRRMNMYKVLKKFRDVTDNDFIYEQGSPYPRKGYEPSNERVAELLSDDGEHRSAPLKGFPLIEVEESIEEPAIEESEVKPVANMGVKELKDFLTRSKVPFDPALKKLALLELAKSVSEE